MENKWFGGRILCDRSVIEDVIRIFRLLSYSCTSLMSLEMSASLFPSKHPTSLPPNMSLSSSWKRSIGIET